MAVSIAVRLRECPLRELRLYFNIAGENWALGVHSGLHIGQSVSSSVLALIFYRKEQKV